MYIYIKLHRYKYTHPRKLKMELKYCNVEVTEKKCLREPWSFHLTVYRNLTGIFASVDYILV